MQDQQPRMLTFAVNETRSIEFRDGPHPTIIRTWNGESLDLEPDASHFIMVFSGSIQVAHGDISTCLGTGCFGTVPESASVSGVGEALIVSSLGYRSMALFGGPLEAHGRLRYVDNCTNSILLSPPVRGEPCLNFLRLPRSTSQTSHTHPSLRVGLVYSGTGRCETPHGMLDLLEGTVFVIPPGSLHSFQSGDTDLRIVIYHPDSDSGPTHTDHTMLNRTFIEGVSARDLPHLQTTEVVPA